MDMRELSMPGVAASLGVTHRALYRYFPTKTHLLRELAAVSFGRISGPRRAGRRWDRWLMDVADVLREALVDQIAVLPNLPAGPDIARIPLFEATLSTLLDAGLTPVQALDACSLISSVCLGAANDTLNRRKYGPPKKKRLDRLRRDVGLGKGTAAARLTSEMAAYDAADGFRRRLGIIIDALRRQAAENRAMRPGQGRLRSRRASS
jgi:AcrR family transcriptional regulator